MIGRINYHNLLQNLWGNAKFLGALQNLGSNSKTLRAATPPSLKLIFIIDKYNLIACTSDGYFPFPTMMRQGF